VPSAFGRRRAGRAGRDRLFARTGGSAGAAFDRTAGRTTRWTAGSLRDVARGGGHGANPNLSVLQLEGEYGHALVHLRRTTAPCSRPGPRRSASGVSTEQRLLAQFSSPVGAPHLGRVLQPEPVRRAATPPAEPPTVAAPAVGEAAAGRPAARGHATGGLPARRRRRCWLGAGCRAARRRLLRRRDSAGEARDLGAPATAPIAE
jgi:hypothetical protein